MTAKEYLSQYRLLKIKINQREQELEEYRSTLGSAGINLSNNVQISPTDALGNSVVRLLYMEAEIEEEIRRLVELKNKIINEIHMLENPLFIEILYKRYIECKTLWDISKEINYDYRYVKRLHGWALKAFGERGA